MNKTFGYARVSTAKQTSDLQLERLCQTGGDEIFVETGSGANRKCPELEKLLQTVREGDTVVIVKLDRLARSLQDPLIDTTTPNGKLILGIFAVLAEYERELIRRRTLDELATAWVSI